MIAVARSLLEFDDDDAYYVDSEERDALKPQVLEHELSNLCRFLEFENHYICLKSSGILNSNDIEAIQANITREDKVFGMVDKLIRGSPDALAVLCYSIDRNGTQQHVLRNLINCYRRKLAEAHEQRIAAASSGDGLPCPGDDGAPPLPWEST